MDSFAYGAKDRISDIATQIALLELVRVAISELCFTPDKAQFRSRVNAIEQMVVDGLQSRTIFPAANEVTEKSIKEQASLLVTKILTSIRHPDDAAADGS